MPEKRGGLAQTNDGFNGYVIDTKRVDGGKQLLWGYSNVKVFSGDRVADTFSSFLG